MIDVKIETLCLIDCTAMSHVCVLVSVKLIVSDWSQMEKINYNDVQFYRFIVSQIFKIGHTCTFKTKVTHIHSVQLNIMVCFLNHLHVQNARWTVVKQFKINCYRGHLRTQHTHYMCQVLNHIIKVYLLKFITLYYIVHAQNFIIIWHV